MNNNKQGQSNPVHVKAALILQGETLRSWSRKNGYKVATVSMALNGNRTSKLSKEIVRKLTRLTKRTMQEHTNA